MTVEDAEHYASAFGIDLDVFLHGHYHHMDSASYERMEASQYDAAKAKKDSGRRLRIARIARGFDSARGAAKSFSFVVPTYLSHENATNSMSPSTVRLYATAFGIKDAWLQNGELPSGLGPQLDLRLKDLEHHPEQVIALRHLVSENEPASPSELELRRAELVTASFSKWTTDAGDIVREIDFSQLERLGLDGLYSKPTGFWPFPKGYVRHALGASVTDLVSIVLLNGCQRFFVDTSDTRLEGSGEFFVLDGSSPPQSRLISGRGRPPPGASVLGRVKAKLLLSEKISPPTSVGR